MHASRTIILDSAGVIIGYFAIFGGTVGCLILQGSMTVDNIITLKEEVRNECLGPVSGNWKNDFSESKWRKEQWKTG